MFEQNMGLSFGQAGFSSKRQKAESTMFHILRKILLWKNILKPKLILSLL